MLSTLSMVPWHGLLVAALTLLVSLGLIPVLAGLYQYVLVLFSLLSTHMERTRPYFPRVSILIPAWNEAAVIQTTVRRLMRLDYPPDRLRVYVIDDASTDGTAEIAIEESKRFRGRVYHIRRVAGGEGKAHTLNYGLDQLWRSEWTEAVLIMDADVIYTPTSLARMARHLADPGVGAVTAYIKEGSRRPNYVQRFVGFEYITATGVSRRAQNVLGFLACLSGGAQLHSRENLLEIGGKIFSHTLAEDTFTTFRTQIYGRKALFEPHAVVYAEEPDDLVGLWKQRVRWARGNVQITSVYRRLWFNRSAHAQMGSFSMGILWFSIFLMPIFQIGASIGLVCLFFLDSDLAWTLFRGFWIISGVTYLIVTAISCAVDPESARNTWIEGLLFPGALSIAVILYTLWPPLVDNLLADLLPQSGTWLHGLSQIGIYAWISLAMLVAWLAKEAERNPKTAFLAPYLLMLAGYGAFLCAVTFGAYIKEWRGASMQWDKTVKTGKVS